MRRSVRLLGSAVGLALLSGCTPSPRHIGGEAVPVGAVKPSSAAPVPVTSSSDPLVLGPDGLGPLKLRMPLDEALATGMLDYEQVGEASKECSESGEYWTYWMRGQKEGLVWLTPELGVVGIWAYGEIATPEGIKLGDSREKVQRAYPDAFDLVGEINYGRSSAKVPGNGDRATYRFSARFGKVSAMSIEVTGQRCFD